MDWRGAVIYGAPGESRTLDLFVRNEMLYPSELRAHWRHYRRFLRVFMMHLATLLCIQREIEGFSAPFAFLFGIPYVHVASRPFPQATH